MLSLLFVLLALLGAGFAGGAYVLCAHPDSTVAGVLAGRLPKLVVRAMLRTGAYFDAGETPGRRAQAPGPVPVDHFGRDASGNIPDGPVRPLAPPATSAPAQPYGVPPLDEVMGPRPAPPPGPVLNGVVIPPDHAAVHARIATFEPENDDALLAFYRGEAYAAVGQAEAWQAHAEMLANALGLDPAFTHIAAQLAETMSEASHDFAIVGARLNQVYGQVQEAISDGLVLPYDARDWLTGTGF